MTPPTHVIAQITDTHLLAASLLYDRVDTAARLERMLAQIEASAARPELLLLTGDLADAGEPGAYRRLRAIVEPAAQRLGAGVLYMLGNHDDRATFRAELIGAAAPLDRVVWLGGLRVIAIDSTCPPDHHGELEDRQLAWLDEQLATPAVEGTVLALHHPPLPSASELSAALSLRAPERLAAVVGGRDVKLILCGHLHRAIGGALRGVPVWSSPALAYDGAGMPRAGRFRAIAGGGATVVEAFGEQLVTTYAPLEEPGTAAIYDRSEAEMLEYVEALR